MKSLNRMTKTELMLEANKLKISADNDITRAGLLSLVAKALREKTGEAESSEPGESLEMPVIDIPQSKSLAGSYVLKCDAMVNDGRHAMGETVELDEENARILLAQGAISVL